MVYRVSNWPIGQTHYDEAQPMAGIFVGTANGGVYGAANSFRANHQSVRFIAPRSGLLTAITIQNRHNTGILINQRAASQPVYQDCLDYWDAQGTPIGNTETYSDNLKAQKCAYTTSNYYSAGNGGTQIFEIRPDVGGVPGPASSVIGKTTTPFEPLFNPVDVMLAHDLTEPAEVIAGCCYHIVVRNLTPVQGQLSNLSLADAYNMPDDVGAFSLNGVDYANAVDVPNQQGPYFRPMATLFSLDATTDPTAWAEDVNSQAWWGAKYSTGQWTGYHTALFDTTRTANINDPSAYNSTYYIGGSRQARELFTATHATVVDGVWVQHGHSSNANGQSMTANLKLGGTVLATATIPHNAAVKSAVTASTSFRDFLANIWSYQPLSTSVSLTAGTQYNIEFSAPNGADFVLLGLSQDWSGSFTPYAEEVALNSQAERSEDSGASWVLYPGTATSYRPNRSLQTLLTVEGMPREISENKILIDLPISQDVTLIDGQLCNNGTTVVEVTSLDPLAGFPIFLQPNECVTVNVPEGACLNITTEGACSGTQVVCALAPTISKRLIPTRINDNVYQWTDESGIVVTLNLTWSPSASGCQLNFINANDPFVILGSDTACSPTPVEFIDVNYEFITDTSNMCSTPTGCQSTPLRVRTRIRDVDVTTKEGVVTGSCVTPIQSVSSPVVPISGNYVEEPSGTFCATGSAAGEGNLYIGDVQQPPSNGDVFSGTIQWTTGGERIAFEVDAQYQLAVEATADCSGNILSAVNCLGVSTDINSLSNIGEIQTTSIEHTKVVAVQNTTDCLPLVLELINGQLHITNQNDVATSTNIINGSAVFSSPIPANSTVIASSYSFDSNGKICIEGYY